MMIIKWKSEHMIRLYGLRPRTKVYESLRKVGLKATGSFGVLGIKYLMIKLNTWKAAKILAVSGALHEPSLREALLKIGFDINSPLYPPTKRYGTAYASGQ